ncbi:MAG TPA: glycerophosphodiester phosphodiesterase family protein [Bauldia sp.]|nr:glycerophosphodiester phosphodiesterase family protein [Bauldia sp.]
MRYLRRAGIGVFVIVLALFALNTELLAPARTGKPTLIAHRGMGQTFHREGLTGETCTAARIFPPEHNYIEDTIPALKAAFDAGADMVEFDVQPTTDGDFVVFHDWTLDCRTDGKGVTREHSLAELRNLDLGYGYTADGGKTFPFRGKGIGMMATLGETLDALPGKRVMINVKSADPTEGTRLAAALATRPASERANWIIYGDNAPIDAFHAAMPDVRVLPTGSLKRCLLQYFAIGWSGYVPGACRHTVFLIPADYARWLWGFPRRFLARMDAVDTMAVLLGPYDGSGFSSGLDAVSELALVPAGYDGALWTNRIDRIGPAVKGH